MNVGRREAAVVLNRVDPLKGAGGEVRAGNVGEGHRSGEVLVN